MTSGATFCEVALPICVSKEDKLTEQTFTDIIKHNQRGVALKCWATTACKG